MVYLKPFSELGKNDAPIAGGKGASLGEMTQAGIPVPPGFVVLADAFEYFIAKTDLVQEIEAILATVNHNEIHTVEKASESIQALILSREMPTDIQAEINTSFGDLDTEYVAVRSSATAEDGTDHAWAGQLESYLNTTETDLLEKVKHCWASLFTPRAIFYRFEKGLHAHKISVAVVVQKMVASEVSGIAFSVHPVTEDRNQIIIEAGFGLGEAIVSGQITPDSYVVEKTPRKILDVNVSTQTRGLYRIEGGGNEWQTIPEPKASSQVLTEAQISEFADLILKIENHYGFPCDIEWAYEGEKFYIVQSRPITTLSSEVAIDDGRKHIPLKKEDAIFTFGSAGTPFVFEEIVSRMYTQWECIRVCKDGNAKVFVARREVERMHQKGTAMTRDFLESKVKIMLEQSEYIESHLQELRNRTSFDSEDLKEFFKPLEVICGNYSFFDIHYTDGMLVGDTFTEAGEYVKSIKNVLRDVLGKPFFSEEGWLRTGLVVLSKQFSIPVSTLEWYTKDDLVHLCEGSPLPDEVANARKRANTIYRDIQGRLTILKGEEALFYWETFDEVSNIHGELHGVVVHRGGGTVTGRVKIVKKDFSDPYLLTRATKEIQAGDILVTDTTDPDFLSIMKKAGAIVTDIGGLLSHASITSRELNKLCVVGTKVATQVLKDGDVVEVDADKGIVTILDRKA